MNRKIDRRKKKERKMSERRGRERELLGVSIDFRGRDRNVRMC